MGSRTAMETKNGNRIPLRGQSGVRAGIKGTPTIQAERPPKRTTRGRRPRLAGNADSVTGLSAPSEETAGPRSFGEKIPGALRSTRATRTLRKRPANLPKATPSDDPYA
jgi:hypothetical protein